MFKNYFKIAWRNLWKHKVDSIINITGLCIAFISALLLLLSVGYEFSYDKFHSNAGNIYRLYFQKQKISGEDIKTSMPAPLAPTLKAEYNDVKYATRYVSGGTVIRYKDKKVAQSVSFADADFFRIFSFPVISGNKAPLQNEDEIVLRKGTAKAIFGEEEPVGKIIQIQRGESWKPFRVSALTDDVPDNSSIKYDAVVKFENTPDYKELSTHWSQFFHEVYILLNEKVKGENFEAKLNPFVNKYYAEEISHIKRDGVRPANNGAYLQLLLQPLKSLHTDPVLSAGDSINKSYLYLLAVIAVLILAIACINFINLSIGKSFTRYKEIGLRKTLGALQKNLAIQFWLEALLVCSIAFIISCIISYLLLPQYKLLFAMHVKQSILHSPAVWLYIIVAFSAITVVAGGYPAWLMSRNNIVEIFRGKVSVSKSNRLRNSLITFQFIIAVLLISCTIISWQQIHYLRTKPLGFNTSQVISVPVEGEINSTRALQLMRDRLSQTSSVISVSGIYDNLGKGADGSSRTSVLTFDYKNRELRSTWMGVSYDLVKTLDLQLVAGRDFSASLPTDSSAVLINEEMAKQIAEKNIINLKLPVDSAKPLTIIGVVKNFNYKSLHKEIEPLALVLDKDFSINYILVKVKPDNLQASMNIVKAAWNSISPDSEYKGSFLDENVNRQYKREEKLMQIFTIGASIAIILSCLGLLAMVILILSQRTKEIGIRKVLGASVKNIIQLIAKDFLKLVLVAAFIASPIAWFIMNKWLQGFAYRINISWLVFVVAGLVTIIVAFITVCTQAIKAALANPVKSIKTE